MCQTEPVKGHVAASFHSNKARTHLIWISQPSKNTTDLDQVCSCLVGMKTCSHMALYWISLTPLVYPITHLSFVCVLIFIRLDIGSAHGWTCLIWPGCGCRLQSEGPTPETWSPETCCGSTTPFSSNTQVEHKSGGLHFTLLQTNLICCDWFVCL